MAEELIDPQVGGDENPFLNALKKFKAGDTPSKQVTSTVTSGVNPFSDEPEKKNGLQKGSSNGSNLLPSGSVPSPSIPTDGGLNDIPSLITGTVPNAPIIDPATRQANTIATPFRQPDLSQALGSTVTNRDNTAITPNPIGQLSPEEKLAQEKDAYYNPKLKDNVSSGDKRLDFLYKNQWLMDAPIIGQKIKDEAYNIAIRSKGTGQVDNVDEVRKQPINYNGNAVFGEDDGPKVNLLDQYFGKISLPASKYKPNSDYLSFLPSVSVKGQFDRKHKDGYDMTDMIKSVSGKSHVSDFSKPIYKSEDTDSKVAEDLGVDLGGHKTGIGFDKQRGLPYVSITDAWDFEPNSYQKGGADKRSGREYVEAALMHKAGSPFKVYDRLYFDPKTNQYIPDDKLPKTNSGTGNVADFQNTTQASLSTNPANRIPQENVVRKAQYPDPIIQNAQAAGQANNDIRNQNQTPQTERSLLEKVEQYAYLPAFNKGFNDLIVKPAAGATDFIDRTIDKAYSSITGEQTPEWLRKKGAFDKVYKYYEDEYEKRDKPTNIASDVAEGVVGTVPLMLGIAAGVGGGGVASQAPQTFSALVKVLAGTGAASAYKDATDQHKDYISSLNDAAEGGIKGGVEGLKLDAQMLVGGALGKGVINKLAEKGLLKGGKVGEALLHALSVGTIFGGTSAGEDLLNDKDIDTNAAFKQFGMGLAFEAIPVGKAINEVIKDKRINDNAAQVATLSNSAANLNAESVLRTLTNTSPEQLLQIRDNIPGSADDLYANSIEQGAKAYETKDTGEKRSLYTNQLALKAQADVKAIVEKLKSPEDVKDMTDIINESDEFTPEQKQELTTKISSLVPEVANDIQPETVPESVQEVQPTTETGVPATSDTQPTAIQEPNLENETITNTGTTEPVTAEVQQPEITAPKIEPTEETFPTGDKDVQKEPVKTAKLEVNQDLSDNGIGLRAVEMPDGKFGIFQEVDGKVMGKSLGRSFETAEALTEAYDGGIKDKLTAESINKANDNVKVRQKAIDLVNHGVLGVENIKPGETVPRLDFEMDAKERTKAVSDIQKGNYDTAPAKKLLAKIEEFERNGEYPVIEGTGGSTVRSKSVSAEEIGKQLDEINNLKLSKELPATEDIKKSFEDIGLTEQDFKDYEQFEKERRLAEPGSGEGRPIEPVKEDVQVSKDDKTDSVPKDESSTELESKPIDENKPVTNKEKAKELADKIRSKKLQTNVNSFALGVTKAAWNGALETAATTIEIGGSIADGLNAAVRYIKEHTEHKNDREIYYALRKELQDTGLIEKSDIDYAKELKDAKLTQKQVERKGKDNELYRELGSIDPRTLTADEIVQYNNLANDTKANTDELAKFIDGVKDRQEAEAEQREKDWYKQFNEDPDFEDREVKQALEDALKLRNEENELPTTVDNNTAKTALKKVLSVQRRDLKTIDVPKEFTEVEKALLSIDETRLSTRQLVEMNRVLDRIIHDNDYAYSGRYISLNDAIKNAKQLLDNSKTRGFQKGQTSEFASDFRSLDQNIEIMAKNTKGAAEVQAKSGISDISAGNAKVNRLANDLSKEFNKLTKGMGKDVQSVENRYKRGMLSLIIQQPAGVEASEHFNQYKTYIRETGEKLSKSEVKSEQREGELVTKLYEEHLKDAETKEDAITNLTKDNPNNAKIVNFFVNKFGERYDLLRRNTLLYSGRDLPFIDSYTPTSFKLLKKYNPLETPDVRITEQSSFDEGDPNINKGQSKTTISRKPIKTLKGTKRVMNLDFDGLMFNKYRDVNYDIETLPSRYLYDNIRQMGDFKETLGGETNTGVVSKGVENIVNRQRGYNKSSPEARAVLGAINIATAKGVRIALKGLGQFAKQYPSVATNTLFNLGKDIDLYPKSIVKIGLNNPIFDQSGIGLRRSQHGGVQFEMRMKQLAKSDFSNDAIKAINTISKAGDWISEKLGFALTASDDAVARNSWGAYYMKALREKGIDVDKVNWDTEYQNIDKDAAAYAEQQVSRNQIQNDPSKQANFLYTGELRNAQDVSKVLFRGLAMPFSSFARNAQARLESDLRKFSGGNKTEATRSMIAGVSEAAMFNGIKYMVLAPIIQAAAGAILSNYGYDKPKEKTAKDFASEIPGQTANDIFLSGFGQLGDYWTIRGINGVYSHLKGSPDAKLMKQYNPNDFGDPDFGMAGIYGILPNQIYQAKQAANYYDGQPEEFMESKDKGTGEYGFQKAQSQLSKKQRALARGVFWMDVLALSGLSDAEALRINQAIFRQIKKQTEPVKQFKKDYLNKAADAEIVDNDE